MGFSFNNRGKGGDADRRISSVLSGGGSAGEAIAERTDSSGKLSAMERFAPPEPIRTSESLLPPVSNHVEPPEQTIDRRTSKATEFPVAIDDGERLHADPDMGKAETAGSDIDEITREATSIFTASATVTATANTTSVEPVAISGVVTNSGPQTAVSRENIPPIETPLPDEGHSCADDDRRVEERRKLDSETDMTVAGQKAAEADARDRDSDRDQSNDNRPDTKAEAEAKREAAAHERRERDRREQERRDAGQPSQRLLGRVMSCDGNFARLVTTAKSIDAELSDFWSVGKLISIESPESRIVGLVYKIHSADQNWVEGRDNLMHVEVELVGEITDGDDGEPIFSQGITHYPALGAIAHRIRQGDLAIVHRRRGKPTTEIGSLSQDSSIGAAVSIEDMLASHFAVVGTTGVGKSSAVSLLLRKVIQERPNLRVLILDPHNEFAAAFPDKAVTIDVDALELPFWLFQFEEFSAVIFRGRTGVEEEADALRDLIPLAKRMYSERSSERSTIVRKPGGNGKTYTVDTPVPYRMADLFALIEDEIGKLEGRHSRVVLKSLKNRLELLTNDPRYKFMFAQRTVEDNMDGILADIFRIPSNGRPITAFQLSGIPSEIVDSVISVLCRMAFDLAVLSRGACEVLVMCEEAHRYVPADRSLGFVPTRQSIARIAKEGRKYGAYLGVVTQRPGELDSTILSQCSTIFAMRLGNEQDQRIIRSAISDSAASTISFLSSIGNREAIAFGNGVATPMRMRFADIPRQELPDTPTFADLGMDENGSKIIDLRGMIRRMRSSGNSEQK